MKKKTEREKGRQGLCWSKKRERERAISLRVPICAAAGIAGRQKSIGWRISVGIVGDSLVYVNNMEINGEWDRPRENWEEKKSNLEDGTEKNHKAGPSLS